MVLHESPKHGNGRLHKTTDQASKVTNYPKEDRFASYHIQSLCRSQSTLDYRLMKLYGFQRSKSRTVKLYHQVVCRDCDTFWPALSPDRVMIDLMKSTRLIRISLHKTQDQTSRNAHRFKNIYCRAPSSLQV